MVNFMKKNLKSLLSVLGLVAFFIVALTFKVKNDPWIYECMGAFTNCTDVFVIGCREEQE